MIRKIFLEIIMAILIGILYNILIHSSSDIINGNLEYNDKLQKKLLMTFGGGVVGVLMGSQFFGSKSKFRNRSVKYGLYMGSVILFIHTLMYNWHKMKDDTRFVILLMSLFILIWYTYQNIGDSKDGDYYDSDYDDDLDEIIYS
jgi:uncharacterized membrane protein